MAMRAYFIEDVLVGTYYRSPRSPWKNGVINYAEKRSDVWAGENSEAFAVRYRVDGSVSDQWATIVVSYGDN